MVTRISYWIDPHVQIEFPAPADSAAQRIGDKVPVPVTVDTMFQTTFTDDKFPLGHINFTMVLTTNNFPEYYKYSIQVMFIGQVESVQEMEAGSVVKIMVSDPENSASRIPLNVLRTVCLFVSV